MKKYKRTQFKKLTFKNQITTITGSLPGVGKTLVSKHIFKSLQKAGYNVILCATTKRASVTGKTATSALNCYVKYPHGKNTHIPKNGFDYVNPTHHPNTEKIFIIDEAMLWSEEKWRNVVNCYPKSKFILIGDSMQFEPVDGYSSLQKSSVSLEHSYRQTDKNFLDFLSKLKIGEVDTNYIKNNFLNKNDDVKYIDCCYTISMEKNLSSEATLYYSPNDNDFLYSLNGKKFFKLSTNEKVLFDLCNENKYTKMNGIHMHLLQGLTLDNKLGLKVHIDDCLSNPFFYDIFVRYLFVSFTRVKNIGQIYVSENDFEKICEIVSNKPSITYNLSKNVSFRTDSDFLLRTTADEMLEIFDETGFNLEKDSHDYFMTDSERKEAMNERFNKPIRMLAKQPYAMYASINPLNRNDWKKKPSDVPGCKSHHWYLFEIDYPKGKTDLIPEAYMQNIKEKYIVPNKNLFFCIVYSGKNSYHCYFYNKFELDEDRYKKLWDAINDDVFDGLCDRSKRCYNASLGRLPFVKRYDTGKLQSLESLTTNAFYYDSKFVDDECKVSIEHPSTNISEGDFSISDIKTIENEKTWIRQHWILTTSDGTNRWKKLCSIVSETSSWSHRTLTNEALTQVYWDIGKEMNLSDQRIEAAVRKMNRKYVKVIGNDVWEEARNRKKEIHQKNDSFIESECQSVYEKHGLKSAIESLYLLYDKFGRKKHIWSFINKNFSKVKINEEYNDFLNKNNYHFTTDLVSFMNGKEEPYVPRTRSIPTVDIAHSNGNSTIATSEGTKVGTSSSPERGYVKHILKVQSYDYKLFEVLQMLTVQEIKAVLSTSKILSFSDKKETARKAMTDKRLDAIFIEKQKVAVSKSNVENKTEFKRNEKIMKDYQKGMKQVDIAKKYKINKSRVSQIIKKMSA